MVEREKVDDAMADWPVKLALMLLLIALSPLGLLFVESRKALLWGLAGTLTYIGAFGLLTTVDVDFRALFHVGTLEAQARELWHLARPLLSEPALYAGLFLFGVVVLATGGYRFLNEAVECENCGRGRYRFEPCQYCGHAHWRD